MSLSSPFSPFSPPPHSSSPRVLKSCRPDFLLELPTLRRFPTHVLYTYVCRTKLIKSFHGAWIRHVSEKDAWKSPLSVDSLPWSHLFGTGKTLSISIVNYGPVRIRATCRNVGNPRECNQRTRNSCPPLQKSNYTGNQKVKTAVYFPAARNDRIVVELLDRFESWPN